jgi:alpha-L-fucosidase 2
MKHLFVSGTAAVAGLLANVVAGTPCPSPPKSNANPWRIWEDEPGANAAFSDLYAIGNGRIGAMFSGNPTSDSIKINENSMWSGGFIDRVNPDALPTVRQMQQLVRDGSFLDAQTLGSMGYAGTPTSTRVYDTLGTMTLAQTLAGNVTGYERWLDVEEAIGGTYFSAGGITY